MKKFITTLLVSCFLLTSNAMSFSLSDANLSVGISGSQAAYYAVGKETNRDEAGAVKTTTKEAGAFTDTYGSIFLEVGLSDIVSLGLDYVLADIDTPTNTSNEDRATPQTASATFSDLTTLYAKINTTLWGTYIKLGYSEVDIKISENSSRTISQPGDTSGYMLGLGFEKEAAEGVSIRAEVAATAFDDVSSNNGVAVTGNRNDYDVSDMMGARGTISLVKSF